MAQDAADVCDALGVSRAHVVGVSLGGLVAQALATAHPELVATLTLASTYRIDDPHPLIAPMLAGTAGDVPDPATIGPLLQAASFSAGFLAEHPDVAARIGADLASTAHASFRATVETHHEAAEVVAPAITAPTLVLGASEDATAPPEVTRHLADAIPGALYELLPCGHLMNVELPERFTALVRAHAGA
jgi:pimeloyl-ACP methyl ester carboxylesterase